MRSGRIGRWVGGPGFALLVGACEVHQAAPPAPPPAGAPAAPVAAEVDVETDEPEPSPAAPQRPGRRRRRQRAAMAAAAQPPLGGQAAEPWAAPLPAPEPISTRYPHRIVHPAPLVTLGTGNLDVHGIVQRPDRKCGPRQLDGGHWIHLDCNVHTPIATAVPASVTEKMIDLWRKGVLRGDDVAGAATGAAAAVAAAGATAGATAGTSAGASSSGSAAPGSVDHRLTGTEGPVKDQGQVGSCTAFSLSSAMDNGIRRQNKGETMSAMHLWAHYGVPTILAAATANSKKPIAIWDFWPYDERVACEMDASGQANDCGPYTPPVSQGSASRDAKVQAQIKAADAAGLWKVTEYDAVPTNPDSLAAVLATGADVWATMDIGKSWLATKTDTIPDWNLFTVDGGHALLFAGYRVVNGQRQFLVHNSWGPSWGDHGYAFVSEPMVRTFIKSAYKVVVASTVAPPPAPAPAKPGAPTPTAPAPAGLTDDDCAANQLVDSVTGQCATICADDSRPADGKCPAAAPPSPGSATAPATPPPPPRGRRGQ